MCRRKRNMWRRKRNSWRRKRKGQGSRGSDRTKLVSGTWTWYGDQIPKDRR